MNYLLSIREAAKNCPDEGLRAALREQADTIDDAIERLAKSPEREDLEVLNGAWARAVLLMRRVLDGTTGPTGGALKEGAELQRKAA